MSDSELIDELFRSLSGFICTKWTGKRHPYYFPQNFRTASSAPSDDTSRIFLESGFKAWVAYIVVKPRTANTNGQASRRRQFAALDRLPVGERKTFAVKVNEVPPHPTIASLIHSMEQDAANIFPSKRRRTEHDDLGLSSPAYPSPSYSQSFNDTSLPNADSSRPADLTAGNLVPAWAPRVYDSMPAFSSIIPCPRPSQLSSDLVRETHNSSTSPEPEILEGADIAELDIFPEYLAGAIKRQDTSPKTAAVTFEFPKDSIEDVNCAMSIVVLPNKVERLASLLFNAHLETNGGRRELILPGGSCVTPKQLQGSRPGAVTNVFGSTVAAALESAPYRKIEVSEAGPRAATRCVTMSECSHAHQGAVITVVLGRREASQMYEKLFNSSKSKPKFA